MSGTAAYYDPNKGGLGVPGYWRFATRSDTAPGNDATNPTIANQANYVASNAVFSVTQDGGYHTSQNYLTDVGLFSNSASAYGTHDQNGDVYQWNDTIYADQGYRGIEGGSWVNSSSAMQSGGAQGGDTPGTADSGYGFRIATVASTPEPSAASSLILAGGLLLARRTRPSASKKTPNGTPTEGEAFHTPRQGGQEFPPSFIFLPRFKFPTSASAKAPGYPPTPVA